MFFCDNYCYPDPTVSSGKINTVEFLEASKGIVKFVELLGTVFSPVKYDISGNIEKLYKIYHSDEEKFKYLNDIIECELNSSGSKIGIDALLWLKRALEYVQIFLTCLVEDYKKGDCTENLNSFFNKAYEEKLKPYHGWIVQKLFAIIICAAPSRKDLIKLLTSGKEGASEADVINDVDSFLQGMNSNLTVIIELYQLYNLDSDAKV